MILALLLAFCFSVVLLVGAPYMPTLRKQIELAFELAKLKPGDTIIELGCGDGRVLVEAAKQGLNSVGYELNPLLFVYAWARTRKYGHRVKVVYGDFWRKKWPPADAIYVFLLPRLMSKLEARIAEVEPANHKVISFAFTFPVHKPVAQNRGVFLYDFSHPGHRLSSL